MVDFVLKNMAYVNVFSHDDIAIFGDAITGFWHLSEGKGNGCAGQGTLPILPPEFFLSMNALAGVRGGTPDTPVIRTYGHCLTRDRLDWGHRGLIRWYSGYSHR